MRYSLDLSKITIDMFFDYINERRLFKTHMILKNDLEVNKTRLKELGYYEISSLYKDIKTKKKVELFCKTHRYDLEYITVLRRHIMSLETKNRKMSDFVRMNKEDMSFLLSKGIHTTKELNEQLDSINVQDRDYLNSVIDLVRMRYLHATYLDCLYYGGYKTMKDVANADYTELSKKVNEAMEMYDISKAKLGLKDAEFLVEDAKLYIKWLDL